MNQCNIIHTLRSGKQVDNQVSMPPIPIQNDSTRASTPSSSTPSNSDNFEKDKLADKVHKPTIPFPNRLKNNNKQTAQTDKIFEVFNQVKISVPLLDAIQQVPIYVKFLKVMSPKGERLMC